MTNDSRGRAAAVEALRAADRILIAGHVGPDGDALGSMLGMAHAARKAGKQAWASFGEPFVLQSQFGYLDQSPLVSPGELPDDIDLFVAVDTAAADRLGSIAPAASAAELVLVIDHHRSNSGFGDVVYVDPDAAATTQLVYHVLVELGWPIDQACATALYTGLVTDTGRFQYSSTSADVHEVAAALLDIGVPHDLIGQRLFEEASFSYYQVVAAVMDRAVLDAEHSLVWSVLFQDDIRQAGVPYEETDALIDLVRIAREADVACLLKEIDSNVFKGSLRSRGRVDVSAVAQELGGGGHHNAAGFTFSGPADGAIAAVRSFLT